MNWVTFLGGLWDGFSLWESLNADFPFAALLGFGVAVVLTLILIRIVKRVGG